MKCYTVDGTGLDSLRLTDRPEPGDPGPKEALVDVRAVSLNYRDLMVADGRYSGKLDPPIIACADMAGTVAKVGSAVTEFKEGDRVLNAPFRFWPSGTLRSEWARTFVGGTGVDGVLAERIVYPAVSLVKVPEHFTSFAEGSTLTIAGLTAWAAVVTHGKTQPGDWVLVHGTGGVSIFAAQIAKKIGANVVLSTSSEAKAKIVREKFGVDAVVDYRDADWPKKVREITGGRGVDVVVEVTGGSLSNSIQACASNGRIGLIGVLAGVECRVNVLHILMRQITVRGVMMESTEELRKLAKALEAWKVHPCIDRVFPFKEARKAYDHLQSQKHIGKVVIELGS